MANEIVSPIPARLKNVAKGGHVAGASDIVDDALNKEQSVVNAERIADVARLDGKIDAVEQKVDDIGDAIQFDQEGDLVTVDGDDFENPEARGKIPTIGAILDGAVGEIERSIGDYDVPMYFTTDRFVCYVYGGFKEGDTIKIKAVGTASTEENTILCRYDDNSNFANLTNNGQEKTITLAKNSSYLYFVVTQENITTSGSINIIVNCGLSKLVKENTEAINGLEFAKDSKFYLCNTDGSESVKVVASGENVVLDTHFDCVVRFVNRNTASNVKIKLGNNEAINCTLIGDPITDINSWDSYQYCRLIFNGSQFVLFPYTKDLTTKIKQDTILLDKNIGNWVGGSFATNTNKFQTTYDILAARRVTADFIAVIKGCTYISNKTIWIQQYNKNYGYLEAGSFNANSQIRFSNETAFIKCDIDTEENLNDLLIKVYRDYVPTTEYDKEYTKEYYDFNGSINAKVTNGKIRIFTEFTIDEDVNIGSGGFRNLLTIGYQNRKMYLGAIQNSTVPLKTWVNGLERHRELDVDFGVPDFKSAFAWQGPVAGRVTYPLRTFPAWKPICGEPYIGVRYKGVVNSTVDENNITTNITSVKMITINPEFVIFRGIVGQSNVTLDRNISLTESMTVKDLVNAINSDQVLSDYLEAFVYSNENIEVRDNLVKCSGVELVTTMPNANEDPSKGTRSICCPAYLFGKIDKTTHTIEIVSDGINARIVFDGQNDGSFFAGNINSSNGMLSSMLNYDLIPVLREDTMIDFSSSEIKVTFKYVRVDVNYTGDAECAEYGRIISNYNPNRIVLMGHPMFDGEEIDGGHPTSVVNTKGYSISQEDLPEFWRADNISNNPDAIVVSESNIVTSTGRMKHFAQYTKDHGYKWLSPDDMLSSKDKRQITILFDDWRINIFYNPLLKHGFTNGCKGNFAIESMFKYVTDDDTKKKLEALHINGWNCYIHGCADETTVGYDIPLRYAEKIYKMTYEQLYDLSGVLNYSVGKQRTEATKYGLNSRVWVYANGGQTVAGLFPVERYGYDLGLMTDFDLSVYWCDAANPLYVKRFESCDRNYFKFFELQAFAEKAPYAIHPRTEHMEIASTSSLYTHLLRWYCYYCTGFPILDAGVVFSSVNTEPTLDGSDCEISRAINQSFPMAVYTPPSQGRVDYFYQSRVVLEQGDTYYWRGWCKTSNGLSYTDVYEFEYE